MSISMDVPAPAKRQTRVEVLGCPVDALTAQETLQVVAQFITSGRPHQHVVVNAAKIVNMRRDADLARDVMGADLINADGMSVVWAARLLGVPVPERVTGIDLFEAIIALAAERGWRPYFLGAREDIVRRVAEVFRERYPQLAVAGLHHGYFTAAEEPEIVREIRASQADILFVAMTSPQKERFLARWKRELGVPFQMGVGGSFDVVAGKTARAPAWMQKVGLEWFFRFAQEPGRMWRRYLVTNATFGGLLALAWARRLGGG
jgi:N-acetylglucosaminyldiphosphoundecaprenol N-acetyl-beta-D-mannosaminyltransferase